MKKLLLLLATLSLSLTLLAGERPVSFERLPQKAQRFITTHFPSLTFSYAKYDSDISERNYEVVFTDGTKIDFKHNGEWTKVECSRSTALPKALLSENIVNYIEANFKNHTIREVERDRRGWEVGLSGDVELIFDRHGRIKWFD